MKKVWLIFYIKKDSLQNMYIYNIKTELDDFIQQNKEKWSYYEVKEIEFELPKEEWIIKYRASSGKEQTCIHIYPSKQEAHKYFTSNFPLYTKPFSIIKLPKPDVT